MGNLRGANAHPSRIGENTDQIGPSFSLRLKTGTNIVRVMAHLTSSVEYAVHSLLWLAGSNGEPVSSGDLAEFQGLSPTFLAKIFPKLEKAGIVRASEGVRGGYVLARKPEHITVLQIVDAIEGNKRLFDCQEIRGRCTLFGASPPNWATSGVCSVHAVVLRAEQAMRDTLAAHSLADLSRDVARKAPPDFSGDVRDWLSDRVRSRTAKRASPATTAGTGHRARKNAKRKSSARKVSGTS